METINIPTIMNLNAVLFYADYLSLHDLYIPITDTCKYYIIFGMPINAAYIHGSGPIYNKESKYFKQSVDELQKIYKRTGPEGVISFLQNMCNVFALGNIDGIRMLNCMFYYENKKIKNISRSTYTKYMKNIRYKHVVEEDGVETVINNTKYVEHANIKLDYHDCEEINRIFEKSYDD